jgi:hypothetical protein
MLPSRAHVMSALVAFVALPATFQWMIMGGGVTRGPAFMFTLIAIALLHRAFQRPSAARAALAGVLAGLAMLSHLEMGLVAAYSGALLFIAQGRNAAGARTAITATATAAAVAAPWAVWIITQHGAGPFTAAAQSGTANVFTPVLLLLQYQATIEPFFQLTAALSLVGACSLLARRQFLLPAWLVATAVFDGRAFPTSASFIVAMMAAYGVVDVLLPLLRNAAPGKSRAPAWLVPGAIALAVTYMGLSSLMVSPRLLTGLAPGERAAMSWVDANTPADARFVVVSSDRWPVDRTSEWLPVLSERVSVATVQGQEWMPDGAFRDAISEYEDLQECADRDAACLDEWTQATGKPFDYVYIPKIPTRFSSTGASRCCQALELFLRQNPAYTTAFDGPGAVIFKRER